MLAFPQLLSGAVAQLPLSRTTQYRSRRNRLKDGKVLQTADPDFEEREWALSLRDLTTAEWQALEDLFQSVRGQLGVFTFLEPGANLLAWSERLGESPWVVSGSLVEGLIDPFEGSSAARIAQSSTATQTLSAPAEYAYAASAWLKTGGGGAALRVFDGAATIAEQQVLPTGQWSRYTLQYSGASTTDTLSFEVLAGPAAPLDVYGLQLEAQQSASAYKRSTSRGGVFANARFGQDALLDELTAPGRHDVRVRIVWTPSQT